jgi:hypothetical protein
MISSVQLMNESCLVLQYFDLSCSCSWPEQEGRWLGQEKEGYCIRRIGKWEIGGIPGGKVVARECGQATQTRPCPLTCTVALVSCFLGEVGNQTKKSPFKKCNRGGVGVIKI